MPSTGKSVPLIKAGDPITAADENALRSQVNSLAAVADLSGSIGGLKGEFPDKNVVDPDHILIKNNTGADLVTIRPVLALGASLKTPVDSNGHAFRIPVINGETPTSDDTGKFAILYGKTTEDGLREAIVSGGTWVRVLVNNSTHTHADIEVGNVTRLQTASSGSARIIELLSVEAGGGDDERWAFVRLSNYSIDSDVADGIVGNCDCSFVDVGTQDCLGGTNNAPATFIIDDLGFLQGNNIWLMLLDNSC